MTRVSGSALRPGDDFSFYKAARAQGATVEEVHARMLRDGLPTAGRVRGLRHIFDLDLDGALAVVAGGAAALRAQRETILRALATDDT